MTNAQSDVRGKYQVIAQIGRGGMAEVFLAVARGPAGVNKLCVIKERRAHLAQDAEGLVMFLDEARLAARLSHPNIVQTYEVGQEADRCFIAMEFLDGQPFHRVRGALRNDDPALLAIHLHILAKVLEALDYAHDLTDLQGQHLDIVHRDVTPQNIFVTYDGHTKLVDFGIAKSTHSSAETRTGVLKGKVGYMSPEQGRGEPVDRRTDIYAVGVMMWEAISGRRMFKGLTEIAMLTRVVQGQIEPLEEICPDAAPELVRITNRALATNKEDRYSTARLMQDEIESYLRHIQQFPTPREISALVTAAFAEDRARIKALIDVRIREIGSADVDESQVPHLDLERVSRTPTGIGFVASQPTSQTFVSVPPTAATNTSSVDLNARKNVSTNARIGVALLGLAVGVGAALYVFRDQGTTSNSAKLASASTEDTITLQVDVTPENARIFLDDASLSTGPFKGNLPKDGRLYRLRIDAPGYTSRLEVVKASSNIRFDISLESALPAVATSTPAERPSQKTRTVVVPQVPPPPVTVKEKPTTRAKQQIDQENPY